MPHSYRNDANGPRLFHFHHICHRSILFCQTSQSLAYVNLKFHLHLKFLECSQCIGLIADIINISVTREVINEDDEIHIASYNRRCERPISIVRISSKTSQHLGLLSFLTFEVSLLFSYSTQVDMFEKSILWSISPLTNLPIHCLEIWPRHLHYNIEELSLTRGFLEALIGDMTILTEELEEPLPNKSSRFKFPCKVPKPTKTKSLNNSFLLFPKTKLYLWLFKK